MKIVPEVVLQGGRVAVIADLHAHNHPTFGGALEAGLNRRFQHVVDTLDRAYHAVRNVAGGTYTMFILGDVFDTTRPTPQMLVAIREVIRQHEVLGARTIIIPGNHDKASEALGNHSLGPLAPYATIIEEPTLLRRDAWLYGAIPFRTGPASKWLLEDINAIASYAGKRPVTYLTHVGLADKDTPPWLQGADDAIHVDMLGDVDLLAGNWHEFKHLVAGTRSGLRQVGALCPTGFDNPSPLPSGTLPYDKSYGSVLVSSGSSKWLRYVVPGPRFHKVFYYDGIEDTLIHAMDMSRSTDCVRYLWLIADHAEVGEARDVLQRLKLAGAVADGRVDIDPVDLARVRSAQTAASIRSAQSVDEAIAGFVGKMALPEGVDRDEVSRQSANYIREAAKTEEP